MENFCGESPANRKRSELPEGSRRYGRRQRTPNAALLPDISTALWNLGKKKRVSPSYLRASGTPFLRQG